VAGESWEQASDSGQAKEAPGKTRNGEQHQGTEVVTAARTGRDR
jgi:hypothetical protein